jgi:uncharacterized UPF0160 family protein
MKLENNMRVVTHSGAFHADDVLSAVILRMAGFEGQFIRTRDSEEIRKADLVFDVGCELDPERGRFDHHQPGGAGVRANGVPFASAGLIWREFGLGVCEGISEKHGVDALMLFEAVDSSFIQGVDALDNGATTGGEFFLKEGGKKVSMKTFNSLISSLNPLSLVERSESLDFDRKFDVAVSFAALLFERIVLQELGKLKAENLIRSMDTGSSILELKEFCPWQEFVSRELPHVLFVLYRSADGCQWNAQAVPVRSDSFENRKKFPKSWAGLRSEELASASGVPDAVFCHSGAFYAAAKSRDGALRLAELAVQA